MDIQNTEAGDSRQALNSEYNLGGCLLVDPLNTVKALQAVLTADDFQNDTVRGIYAAALSLINSGENCDAGLIERKAAELGCVIDPQTFDQIRQCYTTTANAAAHAEIVHEAAQKRRADAVCMDAINGSITTLEAVGKLQEIISRQKHKAVSPLEMTIQYTDYLFSEEEEPPYISTGYLALDRILSGGIMAGGVYTIAARPGTGKTTAAINISENIAAAGKTVLYFSLEMPFRQIMARRVGIVSGIGYAEIGNKKFRADKGKVERVMKALNTISERVFVIYDKPATVEDIEREIRSTENLDIAVIDNLNNVKKEQGKKSFSRYEFMTDITHTLKQIALSTGIPIIALCQLNRTSEQRNDKVPTMADLRDSGSIEEDSDSVILLFRESKYLPEDQKPKPWESEPIDFIVDKNRHGMTGTATFNFYGINARIVENVPFRAEG